LLMIKKTARRKRKYRAGEARRESVSRRNRKKTAVTLRDVAQESGVSTATVSIVLNNAPLARYIPPSTKTRIGSAAKKLGYRPKLVSRFLGAKRNHTVG